MNLQDYQHRSRATALYPDHGHNLIYPTLGLVGEAGEIANKVKKVLRDDGGEVTDARRESLHGELGDVLWYVAQVATELGFDLEEVAQSNLDKLADRQRRGKLGGDGDQR